MANPNATSNDMNVLSSLMTQSLGVVQYQWPNFFPGAGNSFIEDALKPPLTFTIDAPDLHISDLVLLEFDNPGQICPLILMITAAYYFGPLIWMNKALK